MSSASFESDPDPLNGRFWIFVFQDLFLNNLALLYGDTAGLCRCIWRLYFAFGPQHIFFTNQLSLVQNHSHCLVQ